MKKKKTSRKRPKPVKEVPVGPIVHSGTTADGKPRPKD